MTWRYVPSVPILFFALVLIGSLVVWFFSGRMPNLLDWPAVLAALVLISGMGVLVVGLWIPVRISVSDDGIRLGYLHRQEHLVWPQVLALRIGIHRTFRIETSHRLLYLGYPGRTIRAELVHACKRWKRPVVTPMPEEYPEPDAWAPPPVG